MSEEKKMNNTPEEGTEAKDTNPNAADAKSQEPDKQDLSTQNGEKKSVGTVIIDSVKAVGRGCKKAAPYVLTFLGGAGVATLGAWFIGGKEDESNVVDSTATELPEEDSTKQ